MNGLIAVRLITTSGSIGLELSTWISELPSRGSVRVRTSPYASDRVSTQQYRLEPVFQKNALLVDRLGRKVVHCVCLCDQNADESL